MNHWYQVITEYLDPRQAAHKGMITNNAGAAFHAYAIEAQSSRMIAQASRRVVLIKSGMIIAITDYQRELGNVGRTAFADYLGATVAEENYK